MRFVHCFFILTDIGRTVRRCWLWAIRTRIMCFSPRGAFLSLGVALICCSSVFGGARISCQASTSVLTFSGILRGSLSHAGWRHLSTSGNPGPRGYCCKIRRKDGSDALVMRRLFLFSCVKMLYALLIHLCELKW